MKYLVGGGVNQRTCDRRLVMSARRARPLPSMTYGLHAATWDLAINLYRPDFGQLAAGAIEAEPRAYNFAERQHEIRQIIHGRSQKHKVKFECLTGFIGGLGIQRWPEDEWARNILILGDPV